MMIRPGRFNLYLLALWSALPAAVLLVAGCDTFTKKGKASFGVNVFALCGNNLR